MTPNVLEHEEWFDMTPLVLEDKDKLQMMPNVLEHEEW